MNSSSAPVALKRNIGLSLLCFYGLGNILGAGIYILIGKVAEAAGYYSLVAFFIAGLVAGFTALTYAELSSRFPVAAGVAVYLQEGFRFRPLSTIAGVLIAFAGMLSAATILKGFVGYANQFLNWSPDLILFLILALLVALAIWGVAQSVTVAAMLTIIEIIGLLIIIFAGISEWDKLSLLFDHFAEIFDLKKAPLIWPGIVMGALLAFYAFIGFEDMVNLSEEVRHPERTMPRAIIIALIASTLIYAAVALSALLIMHPDDLGASQAPLADVYQTATGRSPWLISLISLTAVVNGALIQIIMASRVFYGMGRRGWIPAFFSRIHAKTQTPILATLIVGGVILSLALYFPLVKLAGFTSVLVLIIFLLVNLALINIKREEMMATQKIDRLEQGVRFSLVVPVLGAIGSTGLLIGYFAN